MEAYLSAAGKISRLAIGDVSAPTQAVFEVPADTAQNYPHRRSAVRNARRHFDQVPVSCRWRIYIQGKGVTGYFQACWVASKASNWK
jgi:hypothetical protein